MKQLEFETSKGRFIVKDLSFIPLDCKGIKLSEITEEQASDIVFRIGHHSNDHLIPSAKQILHSLLKSKGIHLFENPYDLDEQLDCNCDMCYQKLEDAFDEAEQKKHFTTLIFLRYETNRKSKRGFYTLV